MDRAAPALRISEIRNTIEAITQCSPPSALTQLFKDVGMKMRSLTDRALAVPSDESDALASVSAVVDQLRKFITIEAEILTLEKARREALVSLSKFLDVSDAERSEPVVGRGASGAACGAGESLLEVQGQQETDTKQDARPAPSIPTKTQPSSFGWFASDHVDAPLKERANRQPF